MCVLVTPQDHKNSSCPNLTLIDGGGTFTDGRGTGAEALIEAIWEVETRAHKEMLPCSKPPG